MEFKKIIEIFMKHYNFALETDFVDKPISYAMYQTWRYCDEHEKPKGKKNG